MARWPRLEPFTRRVAGRAASPFVALSLFPYEGPVRRAIRAAKYAGASQAAAVFAAQLAEAIEGLWARLLPAGFRPAIVPVPLCPAKFFRRGYNLPALIAAALARRTGWQVDAALLRRRRGGRPQAGLPLCDRRANVARAFYTAPGRVAPPEILLVDDVYTSGATAAACAAALKRAGAHRIVVVTVARALLSADPAP